jgi:hypothetical protein
MVEVARQEPEVGGGVARARLGVDHGEVAVAGEALEEVAVAFEVTAPSEAEELLAREPAGTCGVGGVFGGVVGGLDHLLTFLPA